MTRTTSVRLQWAFGGLVLEYLLLSFLFDARELLGALRLEGLGTVAPLAVAVAAATTLLRRDAFRGFRRTLDGLPPRPRSAWVLAAHLLCFTTLVAWSGHHPRPPKVDVGWLLAWAGLASGSFLLALHAAVPLPSLIRALGQLRKTLATSGAIGAAAFAFGLLTEQLWRPLQGPTLAVVASLLRLFSDEVVTRAAESAVGVRGFVVTIAPVCSGHEGIGLITVLVGAYLVLHRDRLRFPRALLLVPLGVAVSWVFNAVRLALLIGVGVHLSPELALGGFHSKAGWILFCAIGLGLVWLGGRPFFRRDTGADPVEASAATATPYLFPLWVVLATTMVVGLFAARPATYAPAGALGGLLALLVVRRRLPSLALSSVIFPALLGVAVGLLWLVLEPAESGAAAAPTDHEPIWLALRLIGTLVVAPIVEELAFRGYLLRRLVSRGFDESSVALATPLAFVVSSLAFGFLHQRWLAGVIAGAVFAFIYLRRSRLGDAVLAHATANAVIAFAVIVGGRESLWS